MLGFLNIYKPSGMTSNAVVQRIKKKFKIKKIGHMGTLDPMACGILPIAIGKATRLFEYSLDKTKRYTAIFDFGYTTDTLDTTGEEISRHEIDINENELKVKCLDLIGENAQIPPIYSAKNVNGRRAYDLAREGVEFELKPKNITIFKLDLIEKVGKNRYKFDIICSSGTYIRAIARDLAKLCSTWGCMSYLERTETGIFKIDTSNNLDSILQATDISEFLLSPLEVFKNFGVCNISDKQAKDLIDGKVVPYPTFDRETFIINNGNIIGVAKPNLDEIKLTTFLYE